MIHRSRLVVLAVLVLAGTISMMALAQDEDGVLASEELLLEEIIDGDLVAEEAEVAVEEAIPEKGGPEVDSAIDDLDLLEELVAEEDVVAPSPEAPAADPFSALLNANAEPAVEDVVVEEETGALGVEDLAEEAIGPDVPAAAVEEIIDVPVEDVALPGEEEVVVEDVALPGEEEVVAEEVAPIEEPDVDVVAVEALEPPALDGVDVDKEFAELLEIGVEEPPALPGEDVLVEPPAIIEEPAIIEPPAVVAEPAIDVMPEPVAEPMMGEAPMVEPVAEPVVEPEYTARDKKIDEVVAEEQLRRIAIEMHARDLMVKAMEMKDRKQFEQAALLYVEALKNLRRPAAKEYQAQAQLGLANTFYDWALYLETRDQMKEAIEKAGEALKAGHVDGEKLEARLKYELANPPVAPPEVIPPRWKQDGYTENKKTVSDHIRTGREHFAVGEYKKAVDAFESALKAQPGNTEAIRMLQKLGRRQYSISSQELDATRLNMMASVRETWNPRNYAQRTPTDNDLDIGRKQDDAEDERLKILNKMKQIKIPEIDFRQANINDVVAFLQEASVDFDIMAQEGERRGVNIILNLQSTGGAGPAAPPANDNFFADEPAVGGGGGAEVPLITFSARDISLMESVRIVTQVAGLKYRIDGSVVMIVPLNAAEGEVLTRMYDVLPTVIERIQEIAPDLGSMNRNNDFIAIDAPPPSGDVGDLKVFFGEMGVPWPDGSAIRYLPSIAKIVVNNTADNLTRFEKVLAVLNVVPNQIEIEARFVEVSQSDLSSLGFEWLLTDNWELAQQTGAGSTPAALRPRISMQANSGGGGFTRGNRFMNDGSLNSVNDDLLRIGSVLTNPELSFVLHALNQKGHSDLLSAPKVTTQSGSEASIKVVTEYIYPTEFTVTGISGGTDQQGGQNAANVGAVVEPGGFETREVGVILSVMPEVSAEGQMINLTMTPEVVTDPTWKNYGSTYTTYDPNGNPVEQQLNMEQPFFFTRKINTSISIYNGATVVMGGMITENRQDIDDKIPFLGSIPLIGRLFQSRSDRSEKRNLLIFVTARLVDPAGRPVGEKRSLGDAISAGLDGGGDSAGDASMLGGS